MSIIEKPAALDRGITAGLITNFQNKDSTKVIQIKSESDGSVPISLLRSNHNPPGYFPETARVECPHDVKKPKKTERHPESWGGLSGNVCQCSACLEIFNSVSAFDFHRTGKAHARTCLTPG